MPTTWGGVLRGDDGCCCDPFKRSCRHMCAVSKISDPVPLAPQPDHGTSTTQNATSPYKDVLGSIAGACGSENASNGMLDASFVDVPQPAPLEMPALQPDSTTSPTSSAILSTPACLIEPLSSRAPVAPHAPVASHAAPQGLGTSAAKRPRLNPEENTACNLHPSLPAGAAHSPGAMSTNPAVKITNPAVDITNSAAPPDSVSTGRPYVNHILTGGIHDEWVDQGEWNHPHGHPVPPMPEQAGSLSELREEIMQQVYLELDTSLGAGQLTN